MRLENKVALITGGYGGMGRASGRLFCQEGATVFVAGRSREKGEAFVKELTDAGGTACFVELDVVSQDQWDGAVATVKEKAGALHILMNIVGSNALVKFPKVDIDELRTQYEINVTGTVRGIQTCAPLIKDSAGGSIVLIGSVAGITGNFGTGYSSSKWALEGISRSAAYVYADWGIRCNVIQPGWIETDLTASMSSNPLMKRMQHSAMNHTVLLRRSGKAEDRGRLPVEAGRGAIRLPQWSWLGMRRRNCSAAPAPRLPNPRCAGTDARRVPHPDAAAVQRRSRGT